MNVGSLFSGGGLGDFGFMAAGMEISWQCEIDEYCQKILALRYPESKKYRDIKTLKGEELEKVDIITGGFPCQPFSVAGKQQGSSDSRHLWPSMLRLIQECKPRWIVGENVPGIINMGLEDICTELEIEGYEVWPIVFPSHALGAWHKRDRVWIIGHTKHDGLFTSKESRSIKKGSRSSKTKSFETSESKGPTGKYASMANTNKQNVQGCFSESESNWEQTGTIPLSFPRWKWKELLSESPLCRSDDGIADRVHRTKMLGNGQVPACTYVIGKMIMEIEGK